MPQHFKVFEPFRPHFVTSAVTYWIPVFNRLDYFAILADSLNHCIENRGLRIHAYVLMPNHFHLICSQVAGKLSDVMRDLKRFTSRQVTAQLEKDGRLLWLHAMQRAARGQSDARLWDEAFHPEQIHSEPFFRQKADYIHDNPVRAGFVVDPCLWKYSSAGYYYGGEETPVQVTPIEW